MTNQICEYHKIDLPGQMPAKEPKSDRVNAFKRTSIFRAIENTFGKDTWMIAYGHWIVYTPPDPVWGDKKLIGVFHGYLERVVDIVTHDKRFWMTGLYPGTIERIYVEEV